MKPGTMYAVPKASNSQCPMRWITYRRQQKTTAGAHHVTQVLDVTLHDPGHETQPGSQAVRQAHVY